MRDMPLVFPPTVSALEMECHVTERGWHRRSGAKLEAKARCSMAAVHSLEDAAALRCARRQHISALAVQCRAVSVAP